MTRTTGTSLALTKRAVVDALATRLAGVGGMTDVQVSYSMPLKDLDREAIWFSDDATSDLSWRWLQAGTKPVLEEWQTDLVIQVLRRTSDITPGQDAGEQAELRAFAIFAQAQQAIAEDPQIHSSLIWAEFAGFDVVTERNTPQAMTRMTVVVRGRAELYPD